MRALALLAALPLAACGGLAADVEIERFCYTQAVSVLGTGAPVNLPPGSPLGASVDLPLPPLLRARGEATVRIEHATVAATSAGTDLSGIQSLSVQEQTAGVLASYARPSPFSVPIRAIVATGQGVNVARAVSAGNLHLVISASGTPPTGDWTADVTVCAYGKSTIDYF